MRRRIEQNIDIELEIAVETAPGIIVVTTIAAIHPDPENEAPTDIVSRVIAMKMVIGISDRDILPTMATTATTRINAVIDAKAGTSPSRNQRRSSNSSTRLV